MSIKFKAAVLEKFNKKLNIVELATRYPEKDQILVKLKYSGICKSQIMEIDGKRNNKKWLPHMLGHEGSGVITQIGKNINDFKIGDKVFLSWIKNNKKDCSAIKYIKNNQIINAGKVTTFNSFALVSRNRVYHLPKNIDYKTGALLGCAFPTGFGMILKSISKQKKIKLLIIGLGGIGLSSLIAANNLGYKNIHVLEKSKKKIEHVKKYIKNNNIKYYLSNKVITKEYYDNIIETSGNINILSKSLNFIHNKGKIVFASHPDTKLKIKINPHELIKGKKIIGSWGGNIKFEKDIDQITKIIKKSKFINKLFLDKVYSLKQINLAITDFRKGNIVRPLIKF